MSVFLSTQVFFTSNSPWTLSSLVAVLHSIQHSLANAFHPSNPFCLNLIKLWRSDFSRPSRTSTAMYFEPHQDHQSKDPITFFIILPSFLSVYYTVHYYNYYLLKTLRCHAPVSVVHLWCTFQGRLWTWFCPVFASFNTANWMAALANLYCALNTLNIVQDLCHIAIF